jgi:hypothetical protein
MGYARAPSTLGGVGASPSANPFPRPWRRRSLPGAAGQRFPNPIGIVLCLDGNIVAGIKALLLLYCGRYRLAGAQLDPASEARWSSEQQERTC